LNEPTKDFQEKVSRNVWETNFDEVIEFIKKASDTKPWMPDGNTLKPGAISWSWARNHQCKYVGLRIDMRDGGFVILNRDGQRISFEQLKWQYRSETEGAQ